MLFYAISGLINALGSGFVGLFVWLKNRKKRLNQAFALMCLSIVVWSFSYFLWQMSTTKESALFWTRALMAGSIFIPVTYLHFILIFLKKIQEKKKFIIFGYLIFFFFFFANFTSSFVNNVTRKLNFPYWPNPGILYHPFLLLWFFYVIYPIYLLFQELSSTNGVLKNQIKYILAGTIIGYTGGITNYFLWYDILIPPFGNGLVIFFPIIITYAILKHYLFDIRVILTEILVGIMGIILVVLPFLMPTIILKILTSGVFILFCIFGYLLVKGMYTEIENKEEAERFKIASKELKMKLGPSLDLGVITLYISEVLMKTFSVEKISFTIKQPTGEFYELWNNIGFQTREIGFLINQTFLCSYIKKNKKPLVLEKLPFLIKSTKDLEEKKALKLIQEKMRKNKIAVLFPVFQKHILIGIIFIGEKISGKPFSDKDLELLEHLSYQIAVSINNTLLFRELLKDKEMLERFYKRYKSVVEKLKEKEKEI